MRRLLWSSIAVCLSCSTHSERRDESPLARETSKAALHQKPEGAPKKEAKETGGHRDEEADSMLEGADDGSEYPSGSAGAVSVAGKSGLGGIGFAAGGAHGASAAGPARSPAPERAPRSAELKAGSSDDNLQFNAFLDFLARNDRHALPHDVSERVIVEVRDASGLPVPNAIVTVRGEGHAMITRRTYADGRTMLFPSAQPSLRSPSARLRVEGPGTTHEIPFAQSGHHLSIQLDAHRPEARRIPLDIAFVLDTTGSMGDEIDRLKQTMQVIQFQVTHLQPQADVRFGMVMYKDRGDEKITEVVPFTDDIARFRAVLSSVSAGGGGDAPEDVQAGLHDAMKKLRWREEGVRIAFLIGDAAPHLDHGEQYTYLSAMQEAAERGIKFATVGCSGLPVEGEVVWRQLAQYTMGPYVFLSRGERGDSEVSASTVSHHVGSNWVAENLEAIEAGAPGDGRDALAQPAEDRPGAAALDSRADCRVFGSVATLIHPSMRYEMHQAEAWAPHQPSRRLSP